LAPRGRIDGCFDLPGTGFVEAFEIRVEASGEHAVALGVVRGAGEGGTAGIHDPTI